MKNAWIFLAAVCPLVIGVYAYMAHSSILEMLSPNPADAYYNLLVEGFRAGQLNLKKEAPLGLAQLANPYDTNANVLYQFAPYWLHDLSYYKGRLYLYWGVTPALILFWPYVALTGRYLFHSQAVVIFCALGFLTSVGLLRAVWRRYFAEVNVLVVAACALALGLATAVPVLLAQADVYEVPISCGYMLTMLALAAIWCALHEPERRCRWLAAASMAYGLAVGARPNLLFGAVILLVPVAQTWRQSWPRMFSGLLAAIGPIALIGVGLMVYNARRFDNPFEFGVHYQLGGIRQDTGRFLSLSYLWFNFRAYFLEPARWSTRFPYVHDPALPPLPLGYGFSEKSFGVLTNIPLVWLALAVPLAWRNRTGQAVSALRRFVLATALLFGMCALMLGLYWSSAFRHEVDYLPALLLLAAVGILGLERVLADRPVWRRAARWGWGLLLGFSVGFNLFASVGYYAEAHNSVGIGLFQAGKVSEAIAQYQEALRLMPDYPAGHKNLGYTLLQAGRFQEAIDHLEEALRLKPDYADAHVNLGAALAELGKLEDAIRQYKEALRIKPDNPAAHHNIGYALYQQGRVQEAIKEFEAALQIWPGYAEAHNSLGCALLRIGNMQSAIAQYEEALRINPDYAKAHDNLGIALTQAGRAPEAMTHWEEALRLKPEDIEAHYNLGLALERMGRVPEAIGQFDFVLRINPDFAPARQKLERLHAAH